MLCTYSHGSDSRIAAQAAAAAGGAGAHKGFHGSVNWCSLLIRIEIEKLENIGD